MGLPCVACCLCCLLLWQGEGGCYRSPAPQPIVTDYHLGVVCPMDSGRRLASQKSPSLPFSFLCWATIGWEQGPHCNFNLQSSYWLKEGMPRAEGLAARQGGQAVPLLYSTVAAQIVWSGAKVHSEVQVKMLVLAMMQCRTVLWDWCQLSLGTTHTHQTQRYNII